MKKEEIKVGKVIGVYILISAIILSGSLLYSKPKTQNCSIEQKETTIVKIEPLPTCDIFSPGKEDWCQPYIDWGYANGLVMAQRILGEKQMFEKWVKSGRMFSSPYSEKDTCEKIVKDLYDEGHPTASGKIPFRAEVRK